MPSGRKPSLSFEFVVLSLLRSEAKHGYDLYKEMEAWPGLGEVWKLKQSMLYADLNKLEKLGYLQSLPPDLQYAPPRVNFRITEQGKAALETWLKTPVEKPRDFRPEFLAKLLVAAKFGPEYTQNILKLQSEKVQQWLAQDLAMGENLPPQTPELRSIRNFKSLWLRHLAEWLEDCQQCCGTQKEP